MKLFISYGHPQAAICRKICDALRNRGHQVWFDETNIAHGLDWREEIANRIITSDCVLSMIDRYSVRDPGVCLDELSIAIGVHDRNIYYVLLEEQAVAEPPASMTTRQWLDMSDWREHEEDQAWFDSKMKVLIKMVESLKKREFVGIIEELRRKLPMCHVCTSKQESLLRQPFIGREWVKERVDAWLDDPNGTKICFVFGDPGIGKSTFAAHYTHYNGRVAAAIFCDYNNIQFTYPRSVIQTLAFLLACRLPDYRIALVDALDHANDLGMYNESELFDILLAQPLSVGTVDRERETMCILIDGLDESGDKDRNVLTEVLTKYADRLPKWLRILTFSRKVEIITGLFGGADIIDLTCGLEENIADIRAYFDYCLSARFGGDGNYTAMIDRLSENSGGIFLYAIIMANALTKGKMSIEDTGSVPDGLDSAFYRWFQWFFPDIKEYEKDWQMPLACIAASPEPIPEEEIKNVFTWTDTKLNKLKHTLEILFRKDVNDFKKETLQLSHRYISDWLFSDAAGRYQIERENAFRNMGALFLEIFKEDPKQITEYESYYLQDYVIDLPRKKKELLLDGKLHGIIIKYGDYAKNSGWLETAMKYFMLSEELAIGENKRNGLERLKRYERSLSREGIILRLWGQYNEAIELCQKKQELAEILAAERGTIDDLSALSDSYGNAAVLYKIQNQHEEALKAYQWSMELREWILKERDTLDDKRNLSVIYGAIAEIYENKYRYEKALQMSKKGLELSEIIVVSEQGTLDDLNRLSAGYYKAAEIFEKQYQYDNALSLFRKSLELKKKIARKRGLPEDLVGLCTGYEKVAGIYKKEGRYKESLLLSRKSLEVRKKIAAESEVFYDLRNLAVSYSKIAEIYEIEGRYDEALKQYWKGLELFEKIAAERRTLDNLTTLLVSYEKVLGIYDKQSRQHVAVEELYRKILELRSMIVLLQEQKKNKARDFQDHHLRYKRENVASEKHNKSSKEDEWFYAPNSQDLINTDETPSFQPCAGKNGSYNSPHFPAIPLNIFRRVGGEVAPLCTFAPAEGNRANERNGRTEIPDASNYLNLDEEEIVEATKSTPSTGTIHEGETEKNGIKNAIIKAREKNPTHGYSICRICGTRCGSDFVFCPRCGNRLLQLKSSSAMSASREYNSSEKMNGQVYINNPYPAVHYDRPNVSLTYNNQGTSITYNEENSSLLNNYAPLISKVHFSAVAPRVLTKGKYAIIDIVMYQDGFHSVVDEIIKKAETPPQEVRSGAVRVREGAKVEIQLTSPDVVIENNIEEQEWIGDYLIYNFAVMVPIEYAKTQVLFMATVYIDGVIATRLKFIAKSWSLRQQKIKVLQENVLSAFVSYASQDRNRVALIVQGMQKARPDMDIFFDVENLRSGESWEDALWAEIDQRDTLFLCWSRNAAESPWVSREWKYCYKQKGPESIEPIPLEPPSICPPPEELRRKHFNDRLLYLIKAESERMLN